MAKKKTFSEVVSEAVNDITDHGFDKDERIAYWTERIRKAAEESLTPAKKMEQMLRESLMQIYKRLIDKGEYATYHPEVSLFTINRIKPKLRAELNKRILASANLIKLNKQEMVTKTLRRFAGWASSVPAGGAAPGQKKDARDDIKKALQSQSFEERRVLIDQGHKLTASINAVIAEQGSAIALIWKSHWRQPGYDYRDTHKDRDGHVYLLRDNWASQKGLVKPGPAGYYDKVTAVAEEPFCRCWAEYVYSLRDLPADMLTVKGKAALDDARVKIKAGMKQ